MKIVIHIFTLYLFALALAPCGDGGGGIVEMTQHLLNWEHTHETDHADHSNTCGDDACSTFCVCSCCSVAIDIPAEVTRVVPILFIEPTIRPATVKDFLLTFISDPVWQPPTFS